MSEAECTENNNLKHIDRRKEFVVTQKSAAWQRHHDHYVRLERKGKLKPEDMEQYEMAIQREINGQVDPLPTLDVVYFVIFAIGVVVGWLTYWLLFL